MKRLLMALVGSRKQNKRKLRETLGLRFMLKYDILTLALPDRSGQPSRRGAAPLPPDTKKGGLPMMVTYSDLIQIGILIVGIIGLFLSHKKK